MASRRVALVRFVRWAIALGVFVVGGSVRASDPSRPSRGESVTLQYDAPEGCPTKPVFVERVRSRAAHADLAPSAARAVEVRIWKEGAAFHAQIVLPAEGEPADVRAIAGPTCASVTDAAALLVALYLDARHEAVAARAATPPESSARVVHAPPAPERAKRTRARPISRPPSWSVAAEVGTHVALASGLAPSMAYGEQVFVGALVRPGARTTPVLSPTLRLGVSTMRSTRFDQGAYAQLHAVSIEVCPVRLAIASFGFRPCGLGSVGRYGVSAATTTRAGEVERPWRTLGFGAHGEWRVPLPAAILLELDVDLDAPLVQDRFFRGTTPIHRTPPTVLTIALGLAVRWP